MAVEINEIPFLVVGEISGVEKALEKFSLADSGNSTAIEPPD